MNFRLQLFKWATFRARWPYPPILFLHPAPRVASAIPVNLAFPSHLRLLPGAALLRSLRKMAGRWGFLEALLFPRLGPALFWAAAWTLQTAACWRDGGRDSLAASEQPAGVAEQDRGASGRRQCCARYPQRGRHHYGQRGQVREWRRGRKDAFRRGSRGVGRRFFSPFPLRRKGGKGALRSG